MIRSRSTTGKFSIPSAFTRSAQANTRFSFMCFSDRCFLSRPCNVLAKSSLLIQFKLNTHRKHPTFTICLISCPIIPNKLVKVAETLESFNQCQKQFMQRRSSSSKTRIHSSRMRTVCCSGRLSCHACPPLPRMPPPCHACPPAMHAPHGQNS